MSKGHENRQFFTFSLELNFFPVFSRVEFIPPPGGGALLAKIFTLVGLYIWKKYTYGHSITSKDPFQTHPPTHNVKLTFCVVTWVWTVPLVYLKLYNFFSVIYQMCFKKFRSHVARTLAVRSHTQGHDFLIFQMCIFTYLKYVNLFLIINSMCFTKLRFQVARPSVVRSHTQGHGFFISQRCLLIYLKCCDLFLIIN